MRYALIAFIMGILSIRFIPVLPLTPYCLALALLGTALSFWRFYPIGLFLVGVAWGSFYASQIIDDRLDQHYDGRVLWIEGTVVGLPEQNDQVIRFYIKNNVTQETTLPHLIRLSWYHGQTVVTGERWKLLVRLKYPRGTVNPNSFDYEAWLTAKHIGATGTVKKAERLSISEGVATWRYQLREKLLAVSAVGQNNELVALVLGDGSGIAHKTWQILQDTGTVHLMVISGQHITLLAGGVYLLIVLLVRWGLWPRALPWLPFACSMAMLSGLAYGYLAGFDIPVQRACIMLLIVLLWRMRFRFLGVLTPFLLTLGVVLAYDPLASLQAGFWLSFLAVALLLLGFSGRLGRCAWWYNALKVEWLMTIALMPMLFALLLPASLTAPMANLIAVPIISFIVVPMALLGTVLLYIPYVGTSLLWLAGFFLKGLLALLGAIAYLLPAWIAPALPWWLLCIVFLGVLLLISPRGIPLKGFGWVLCLPLVFPPLKNIEKGHAAITVFDVGQGLSVLISTQHHHLLYDTGPSFGDFNLGERVVVPALLRAGVDKLDKVIVSHADTDHAGGLLPVVDRITTHHIMSGEANKLLVERVVQPCVESNWVWDGVRFSVWHWSEAKTGNDKSCMLMVEAKGERLLLTGDISHRAETQWRLTHNDQVPYKIQWLVAPHHGSNTASTKAFLGHILPDNVIISRGWLNPFNHPHPRVLERYKEVGADVFDTAKVGAISVALGQYLPVKRQRDVKYFWRKDAFR